MKHRRQTNDGGKSPSRQVNQATQDPTLEPVFYLQADASPKLRLEGHPVRPVFPGGSPAVLLFRPVDRTSHAQIANLPEDCTY